MTTTTKPVGPWGLAGLHIAPSTWPCSAETHTWAEAIEVANDVVGEWATEGRASIRREGRRWIVRWRARPVAMN